MIRRAMLVVSAAFVLVVATGAPVWAHITVNPREADAGGFAKLTFRVPNERDEAGTTQVEVNMPTDHPIANVSVKPVPGWEYTVERRTLEEPITVHGNEVSEVVGKITWTGGRVAPGEFQEFDVSVGPLPEDADALQFPAIQTYESGEVVRWIEEPLEGGEEPEHPVPVLTLLPASDGDADDGGDDGGDDGEATAVDSQAASATGDSDDDSNALAIVALVVGVVGLLVGGAAFARAARAR